MNYELQGISERLYYAFLCIRGVSQQTIPAVSTSRSSAIKNTPKKNDRKPKNGPRSRPAKE